MKSIFNLIIGILNLIISFTSIYLGYDYIGLFNGISAGSNITYFISDIYIRQIKENISRFKDK